MCRIDEYDDIDDIDEYDKCVLCGSEFLPGFGYATEYCCFDCYEDDMEDAWHIR